MAKGAVVDDWAEACVVIDNFRLITLQRPNI